MSETLATGDSISCLSSTLSFSNFFVVDKVGRGGGLAVMWKNNLCCTVVNSSLNHINVNILEKGSPIRRVTCYYGFPERNRRQEAWDFLRSLSQAASTPWCIFGDFNDLLYTSDKWGKHPHPQALFDSFRAAIDDCRL